ncbi:MAG TPA: DMT family transporter [Trebonia sp.]|nr:DMT family transporter [Trebonia sp.]
MATARALDDGMLPTAGSAARARRAGQGAGLALGLLSAMCFGTSGTSAAALIAAGWSPAGAVLARVCVAALALTVPALIALRGRWGLLRRSAGQVVLYGLVGVAACQFCYFNAIARMDVGIAILLEYLGIVLIVGWLWVRHGQRPRPLTVLGGLAALGGLALMLDLSGAGGVSLAGVAWALAAAVSMAVYFFQSARTSAADGGDALPPVALTWGGMLTGAAALALLGAARLAPLRFSAADVTLLNARVSWVVPVLALGVIAAAIAYVTGIGAARRLGAKLGSFVALAEVLFAAGFAWLLLHQVPTGMQVLGGLLILAGVVAVRLDEA